MKKKYEKMFRLAIPYLKKNKRKDFVLHTKGVIKAMELLTKGEGGDKDIMMAAAVLHDVGWYSVPQKLSLSKVEKDNIRALRIHLKYAPPIIETILSKLGYSKHRIRIVSELVVSHKFSRPKRLDKRMLIDADAVADSFKEQFYSDCKAYGTSPRKNYYYRMKNKFYTKTATKIFANEMRKRKKEVF